MNYTIIKNNHIKDIQVLSTYPDRFSIILLYALHQLVVINYKKSHSYIKDAMILFSLNYNIDNISMYLNKDTQIILETDDFKTLKKYILEYGIVEQL